MSIADWVQQTLSTATPFLIYIALGLIVFVETGILVAFFLPGDSILFGAGLLAATRDDTNILILAIVVFLAAFVGDQFGFVLGRKFGRNYLERSNSTKAKSMVARAENFYGKYGWTAVILARFYPWIRTFIPPIAGIGKMNYYKFLSANALGALIWGMGITLLGYYSAQLPVLKDSSRGIAGFFIILTIAITVRNFIRARKTN